MSKQLFEEDEDMAEAQDDDKIINLEQAKTEAQDRLFDEMTTYPEAWMATLNHDVMRVGDIALTLDVGDSFASPNGLHIFRSNDVQGLYDDVQHWVEFDSLWHSDAAQHSFSREIFTALDCAGTQGAYYLKLDNRTDRTEGKPVPPDPEVVTRHIAHRAPTKMRQWIKLCAKHRLSFADSATAVAAYRDLEKHFKVYADVPREALIAAYEALTA